ncbi:MAG: DUF58 domain-containing protein [Eubacterium sp.]|nr:DUF58 domain-containing protein [Eubacterium sp.]
MKLVSAVIILAICYIVQKILYRKFWMKGLDTEIRFSQDFIECGQSAEIIEVVTNDKFLPLPAFHLKFSVDKSLKFDDIKNSKVTDLFHKNELFIIMGHQRITRRLSFTGTARGVVGVNNASILVRDIFMTDTYAARMPHSDKLYVFPAKIRTDNFDLFFKGLLGEVEAKRSLVEDSLTFRGVREYQSFDPYRSINWKKSARAGELMVNMYGYTTDSRVRILLNLDNNYMIETNKLLEEAISIVSSISTELLKRGVGVSVKTNGTNSDDILLPEIREGAEISHAITIDRMLTEIKGSKEKVFFIDMIKEETQNIKRNIFYIIVSPYAREDLMIHVDNMYKKGAAIHMIVPCYDEYPYISDKPYSSGWEVPINV